MWEVQRDRRMRIWGDTPIKGPPAFTPGSIMRHRGTCLRPPDAVASHRVTSFKRIQLISKRAVRHIGSAIFNF